MSHPIPTNSNTDVKLTDLCDECGHEIRRHNDKYGCEYERGDAWVEGENCGGLVAQGPCGCTAWTVEMIEQLEAE
jgi:hypothetical protein